MSTEQAFENGKAEYLEQEYKVITIDPDEVSDAMELYEMALTIAVDVSFGNEHLPGMLDRFKAQYEASEKRRWSLINPEVSRD